MIKAILFDLDDTLLINPTEGFVIEYLRLADKYFAQRWEYPHIARILLSTMRLLKTRDTFTQTNYDVLVNAISEQTGREKTSVTMAFEDFLSSYYPSLQACTQALPQAAEIVENLRSRDYAIIIATNPIYPALAIQQRLAWAALPDTPGYYAFVSHAQNMHFIKPSSAYYAEIIARVGVEPDEAIMVGDSWDNDIAPARRLGLHTYQVTPQSLASENNGTIHQFYDLAANSDWFETLTPFPHTPEMVIQELQGNVAALFGMLSEVKPHFWNQHPDPHEWSPLQVICHLYESEKSVQRTRLVQILREDTPFLSVPKTPLGPTMFICEATGEEYAQLFASERAKTLDILCSLNPQDWTRPARHSIFGPTTLLEMAHFTAQHDRLHLQQLCQTLGKCN